MYWGVSILGGRRYTQTVEKSYHISKAVLDVPIDAKNPNKRVQLMLEHNNSTFLLCNLNSDHIPQVDLDLIFTEGEEVTFFLKGEGTVYLSGYILDFDDEEFSDDENLDEEDLSDEQSEDEVVTNENTKRQLQVQGVSNNKKAKNSVKAAKVAENGLEDDDEEEDDDNVLGELDDDMDSLDDEEDEDEEEEDEEDEDEDEKPAAPKQGQKQVNGQAAKQAFQPKGKEQQNQKIFGSANKPNGQPQKGGQANQKNFGQKGQQKQQGNQNQKGGAQQKPQFNQNKMQGNKSFTPDQKAGSKKLPSGLQIDDLHVGQGPEAKSGKFVHVRYVGKLPNNKEFDRSGNKPFSFRLGAGEVIKGWDMGVSGMRVGGKRRLVVPSNLGYGNRSMGPIPANSTLNFDVELVAVS